jgi:Ca-activated chloride channel family protein
LLAALPVLSGLGTLAWYRRRRAALLLGNMGPPHGAAGRGRGRRILRSLCVTGGLAALVLGTAGPQWGQEPGRAENTASGRDVVVVLDLSRSMLAEQPSRQERALRALDDLANTLQARGGHRVALVVFAAQARLVFPLTSDYDHFRAMVARQDADNLPPALRPQKNEPGRSGTRIGEALRVAVAAQDPRFKGAQDILLLSDGDDPAGDDEWAAGAAAARAQGIPVHTIGIGDPQTPSPIPTRQGWLTHDGQVVLTRLEERPLQEIARRTHGVYVPALTRALALGKWFRAVIEPRGNRPDGDTGETALPRYRPRYAWFFGAALGLLAVPLLTGRWGRRRSRRASDGPTSQRAWGLLILAALALTGVSAAPLLEPEDLVRQGNAAFAREQYDQALKRYTAAEARMTDPGLVAFNEGATLYRLGQYEAAARHFRRALEGADGPRQARALYNLGNCCLQQAADQDIKGLQKAISCFEQCLAQDQADPELRAQAAHNLELARLLWHEARKAGRTAPPTEDPERGNDTAADEHGDRGPRPAGSEKPGARPDPQKRLGPQAPADGHSQPIESDQQTPGKGPLQPLPDRDELVPLPPEDTAAHLEQAATRILRETRSYRQDAARVPPNTKDW